MYITRPEQRANTSFDPQVRELGDMLLRNASISGRRLDFSLETVMRVALDYRQQHPERIPENWAPPNISDEDIRALRAEAGACEVSPDRVVRAFQDAAVLIPAFGGTREGVDSAIRLACERNPEVERFFRAYASAISGWDIHIRQPILSSGTLIRPIITTDGHLDRNQSDLFRLTRREFLAGRQQIANPILDDNFDFSFSGDSVRLDGPERSAPAPRVTGQQLVEQAIRRWGGDVDAVLRNIRLLERGSHLPGSGVNVQIASALYQTFESNGVSLNDVMRGWSRLERVTQGGIIASVQTAYRPSAAPETREVRESAALAQRQPGPGLPGSRGYGVPAPEELLASGGRDALVRYVRGHHMSPPIVFGYLQELERHPRTHYTSPPAAALAERIFRRLQQGRFRPSDIMAGWIGLTSTRQVELINLLRGTDTPDRRRRA
jgi:hypothetical protein